MNMKWTYGVTTVPSRRDTLLPRTLASLAAAGFDRARLFVDGCPSGAAYAALGLPLTLRHETIGAYGNWLLALWELYQRDPLADRYALFQDDLVTVRNLRGYLDQAPYPDRGYLNLYTFPANQQLAEGRRGFYRANQRGLGAVALVLSQAATVALLGNSHLVERLRVRIDKGKSPQRALDGAVVDAMRKAGWSEFVHNPSLVQHTGDVSSIGNGSHPQAPSFPGEEFDALSLLAPAARVQAAPLPTPTYDHLLAHWRAAGGSPDWSAPPTLIENLCRIARERRASEDDETLRPTRTLEFGCGLSTLAFDRQETLHTAVEHDLAEIERVRKLLRRNTNVTLVHAPLKDGWYDWAPEYGTLYDWILIDGPPGKYGRHKAVERVPHLLAPGGTILVDDTHRVAEQQISQALAQQLGLHRHRAADGQRGYDVLAAPPEPLGEGPGTELHRFLQSMPHMPVCQQCYSLAARMNRWGVAGCRTRLEEIVEDMLPRARRWWENSDVWMKKDAFFSGQDTLYERLTIAAKTALSVEAGLRESIRLRVTKAIEEAERNPLADAGDTAVAEVAGIAAAPADDITAPAASAPPTAATAR